MPEDRGARNGGQGYRAATIAVGAAVRAARHAVIPLAEGRENPSNGPVQAFQARRRALRALDS